MALEAHEDVPWTEPYDGNNTHNEPRPDTVIYQQVFSDLRLYIQQCTDLLQDPLEKSGYSNVITEALLEDVRNRTKAKEPDDTMYSIEGEMESGKSSVTNSVLGVGIIARKGNSGGSCTLVVQRFMKTFADQTSPFAARVYFFDEDKIRGIIESLFARYYSAAGLDREDPEEPEEADQQAQNFTEMETTLDAFLALFGDQEEFADYASAKEYLSRAQSEDDSAMIDDLVGWAVDLVNIHLDGGEFVPVSANTAAELLWTLQPYTYTLAGLVGSTTTVLWPLVSVIDFGFSHPLLDLGIILVDGSGKKDANRVRVQNAADWQLKCSHKIVVAQIGRITDNQAIREELALGYRTRGSGNVVLVLTHGDECDEDTDLHGNPSEVRTLQALKGERTALSAEKRQLGIKSKRPGLSREEKNDLMQSVGLLGEQEKRKRDELTALRCGMRNRAVVSVLQQQYKNMTRDPRPLSVHVVGNEAYKQHQAGYSADDKPALSVQQTGIPELRKRFYLIPAEGKLNEALNLAEVQLPSLANSFELFCDRAHLARQPEIEALISRPKDEVKGILQAGLDKLRSETNRLLLRPMMTDEAEWVSQARDLCRKWGTQYRSNNLAMFKAYGCKKGNAKRGAPSVDWNAELGHINQDEMEAYLDDVFNAPLFVYEDIRKKIRKVMKDTQTKIRNDKQFNLMALGAFLRFYTAEVPVALGLIDRATTKLKKAMSQVQSDMLIPGPSSYIARAMTPIYEEVGRQRGAGAPQRRIDMFERRVASASGVWDTMHKHIDKDLSRIYRQNLTELKNDLEKAFESIVQKFRYVCEGTVVKDPAQALQEEQLLKELRPRVQEVRRMLDGPVHECVEACKNYSTMSARKLVPKEESPLFVK